MLKGQYIHTSKDQGTITALKKYFRKYCTYDNSFKKKYFTLGGSCRLDGTPSQSEIFSVIVACMYFINSCGTFVQ